MVRGKEKKVHMYPSQRGRFGFRDSRSDQSPLVSFSRKLAPDLRKVSVVECSEEVLYRMQ